MNVAIENEHITIEIREMPTLAKLLKAYHARFIELSINPDGSWLAAVNGVAVVSTPDYAEHVNGVAVVGAKVAGVICAKGATGITLERLPHDVVIGSDVTPVTVSVPSLSGDRESRAAAFSAVNSARGANVDWPRFVAQAKIAARYSSYDVDKNCVVVHGANIFATDRYALTWQGVGSGGQFAAIDASLIACAEKIRHKSPRGETPNISVLPDNQVAVRTPVGGGGHVIVTCKPNSGIVEAWGSLPDTLRKFVANPGAHVGEFPVSVREVIAAVAAVRDESRAALRAAGMSASNANGFDTLRKLVDVSAADDGSLTLRARVRPDGDGGDWIKLSEMRVGGGRVWASCAFGAFDPERLHDALSCLAPTATEADGFQVFSDNNGAIRFTTDAAGALLMPVRGQE